MTSVWNAANKLDTGTGIAMYVSDNAGLVLPVILPRKCGTPVLSCWYSRRQTRQPDAMSTVAPAIVIVPAKTADGAYYEAKWRDSGGRQVKRRLGQAWSM